MFDTNIKSLFDLQKRFPDEQSCIDYLEHILWAGTPVSPFDPESKVYKCKNNRYKCKNTGKYFNIRNNTFMEASNIPIQKWLFAIWVVTSHKKGISSMQLSRDIDVTQKTAWFLLVRIRKCFGIENYNELDGVVEADESFYGGKNKNRHANKKVKNSQGRSCVDKVPILGLIQRGGKITAVVTKDTSTEQLQTIIKQYVKPNSILISDDWKAYKGLEKEYQHFAIKHAGSGYKHDFGREVHTNNIEGFWKIMKNSLRDMYCNVSRKHIQDYVNEVSYRYNMRKHPDSDKFNWLLANSKVRTTYKSLTL